MDAGPRVVVIGNLNIDLVFYPVNALPAWGEEKTSASMFVRAAGSAGYSALALGKLGVHPRVIGNVGADHYGTFILDALRVACVDTGGVRVAGSPTGVSVALTDERGERAFVTYPGHLREFSSEWVLDEVRSLPLVRYCLLSGYFLLPALGPAGAIEVLRCCQERGGTTLLDTGDDPQGWQSGTIRELRHVLNEVDIFLPNREEALAISGMKTIGDAATTLLSGGPRSSLSNRVGTEASLPRRPVSRPNRPSLCRFLTRRGRGMRSTPGQSLHLQTSGPPGKSSGLPTHWHPARSPEWKTGSRPSRRSYTRWGVNVCSR